MRCPWELLYADDLVIIADTMEELNSRLSTWKLHMETKGLRVNMGKTKIMCSGKGMNILKDTGKYPCGVCRSGVGSNSIFCTGCAHWVHKACSGNQGRLREDPTFRCTRCRRTARPVDGRPVEHVCIDDHQLDVVEKFCYLGDTISAEGGSLSSVTARCRAAWGKFRELLPILTNRSLSLHTRGSIYTTCVRSVMLYSSECWPIRNQECARLYQNERAMIRWVCGVPTNSVVDTTTLYVRLNITHLDTTLRCNRLCWFGHVRRSQSWTKKCQSLEVEGRVGMGRPRQTWMDNIKEDLQTWNLTADVADNRDEWRESLRTAI